MAKSKREIGNQKNRNSHSKYQYENNYENNGEENYNDNIRYVNGDGHIPNFDNDYSNYDSNLENNGNNGDQVQYIDNESNDDNSDFLKNKGTIILYVFGGVIGVYLVISLVIYVASFFIKSKNDEIAEEFMKQMNQQNQFYMDPKFNKSPTVDAKEMEEKNKYTENDDIWENYIVTGTKDDVSYNVNKNDDYPVTAPVSPLVSSPLRKYSNEKLAVPRKENGYNLQKSHTNDSVLVTKKENTSDNLLVPRKENGNNLRKSYAESLSDSINYISRGSNSTSSSTASVAHLIPKHQKYGHDESSQIHNGSRSPQIQNGIRSPQIQNGSRSPQIQNGSRSPQIQNGSRRSSQGSYIKMYNSPVQGSSLLDIQIPKIPTKPTPSLRSTSPNRSPNRNSTEYQGPQGGFQNPMNTRSPSPQSPSQINSNYQLNYNQLGYGQNQLNRNALNYNSRQ